MTTAPVPEWPHIEAVARPDGSGELTIDGTSFPIQALTIEEARLAILARIADTAAELQRPVRVLASEPDGQWPLIVHPDGRIRADDSRPVSLLPDGPSDASEPSVFAPKPAGTGETAAPGEVEALGEAGAPEPAPVTGLAEPAAEEPDGDAWARAARQAQAAAVSTGPQEVVDSVPLTEVPDDETVARTPGVVVDSAPSVEVPDDETVARVPEELVDSAPSVDPVGDETVARAPGVVVESVPVVDVPGDETVARVPGAVVGSAPSVDPVDDETMKRARGERVGTAPFIEPPGDYPGDDPADDPADDTVARAPGEAVDTAPAPVPAAVPRRRRTLQVTVAAAGAVVLVAAGAFAVVALTGNLPGSEPTASEAALPGKGATLPVQAPAGYDQTALWSVPVGSDPQVLLAPDGGVLAAPVGDDRITILDRATGAAAWEGRDPVEDLHVSQVGEKPVLAADGPGVLHVWPLDTPDPAGVAPTTIELGSDEAEVTYDGTAPLIVLPDQAVALLDGSAEPVRREVPDGATPVAATPQQVVAVGADAWWIITADADPVRSKLPRPEQAVGDPTAAIAVGGNQLAVVWRTEDSAKDVLALVGLNRNAIRVTSLIPSSAFPPDTEPLRDRAGSARTIGPIFLNVGRKPVIADLGDIAPEAVLGRSVHGTSKDRPAVATWTPDGVKLKVAEKAGESAPIAALTKEIAFVVASKDDENVLYALPRTEGKKP